jgi:phosphoglycerate dehydrogenase-like enzyme
MKVALPARLRSRFHQLTTHAETAWYADVDSCVAVVADAEVLWIDFSVDSIDRVLDAGTKLRWVTTSATGLDGWPLQGIEKRGLLLTNGAGLCAIPMSEYVVMVLLAGLKGMPELVRAQDRREWLKRPPRFAELRGKQALVYGYGSIGRAIGERLRLFGVTVTGVRLHATEEPGVIAAVSWEAHLPKADLLILSVPLTAATRALVGESQLALLPQGAWVVNVARGGLIDEKALLSALKGGHLGGACLDVTATEPLPVGSELWSLPNVILTPHSSWASSHLTGRAIAIFRENLDQFLRGGPLRNVVDLRAGY